MAKGAHQVGQGGKLVTAITRREAPEAELKALLKQLKAAAGTGGEERRPWAELERSLNHRSGHG